MQRQTRTLAMSVLMTLIFLALVGMFMTAGRQFVPGVTAQSADSEPVIPGTITVVGEGKVRIRPDIARATIGVEVVKPTVREASMESKQTIEEVVNALKALGVAEENIQTSGFSIWAERIGDQGSNGESDTRYHVTNSVVVVIREIDNIGALLDGALEAGANNIYGIEFKLEDPTLIEGKARQAAVEDAYAKAEELAALSGVSLGEVVSVSEIIGAGGGYYAGGFSRSEGFGGGGDASISPGELNLTTQLQVSYAIQR